ncbi:MAG: NADH-quinone oxidoreductase subunit L [bacterium]|nr:NADH-quinone oxidoreductase subunit L [bacterium]
MTGPAEYDLLHWIPALPLIAAVIHGLCLGLLRQPLPRIATIALSCGATGLTFVFSFVALLALTELPAGSRVLQEGLFTWIGAGPFSAEVAFLLDPLSAVMILIVSGVGFLIHVYSIGYMDADAREDKGFQRFFAYLNLFTFSMLVLVLADNLLLMFLGWEGVGLCSYLLIGFWYSDEWNAYCGSKAFIVNRIGDFGFLVGMFLLFWALQDVGRGTVTFQELQAAFPLIADQVVQLPDWLGGAQWKLATLIGLCFFLGAAGKSAQLPLYVWLPDAMAGPTPVSALIHAATMVTAGVYLVCRMSFLYAAAPGASAVIAWVGALTALFAAVVAIAQTDIKKVLAYSTVSQLGFMFLAAGCGAYGAAIWHLTTHAWFKALLFLAAGSVILAVHHEQDIDKMGGLHRFLVWTRLTFLAGVLAIAGAPYLSGFFSKDEILLSVHLANHVPGHAILYRVALFTAGLTAFYMFRLYFRVFFGECRMTREQQGSIQESPRTVTIPLIILAILAVAGGVVFGPSEAFIPIEDANSFGNFVAPVLASMSHDVEHSLEWKLAAVATLVAFSGAALAYWLYVARPAYPAKIRGLLGGAFRLVEGRFWVDELYDRILVQPFVRISDRLLYRGIDSRLLDGLLIGGTARGVRALAADMLKYAQSGLVQGYLFLMLVGTLAIIGYLAT